MTHMTKMILLVKIQSLEGQMLALESQVARLAEERDQLIHDKLTLEGKISALNMQCDRKGELNQKMTNAICHARDFIQNADDVLRVATGYSL